MRRFHIRIALSFATVLGLATVWFGSAPHRIAVSQPIEEEPYITEGLLVAKTPHMMWLDAGGEFVWLTVAPTSEFWKGGTVSADSFEIGDDVDVRASQSHVIENADANLTRLNGAIVDGQWPDYLVLSQGPENGWKREWTRIKISSSAHFFGPNGDEIPTPHELARGSVVDVIGLQLPDRVLATTVFL